MEEILGLITRYGLRYTLLTTNFASSLRLKDCMQYTVCTSNTLREVITSVSPSRCYWHTLNTITFRATQCRSRSSNPCEVISSNEVRWERWQGRRNEFSYYEQWVVLVCNNGHHHGDHCTLLYIQSVQR